MTPTPANPALASDNLRPAALRPVLVGDPDPVPVTPTVLVPVPLCPFEVDDAVDEVLLEYTLT